MIEMLPNGDDHDHDDHEHDHGHHHVHEQEDDHETGLERQQTLLFFKSQDRVNVFIVRHSHWDYTWYRARPSSAMREVQRIRDIVNAGLPYTFEQTATAIEYMEGGGEPMKEQFERLVRDGTFEMIPLYIQQDVYLGGEESLFANIEIGARDIRKMGGEPSKALYLPDTFGHHAGMPKIIRHAGFDNLIFARGFGPEVENGAVQRMRSDDGSEIMLIPMQGSYDNGRGLTNSREINGEWKDTDAHPELKVEVTEFAVKALMKRFESRYEIIDMPHMLLGNGSDFTKLDTELQDVLAKVQEVMQDEFTGLEFQFGSYEQYVDLVKDSARSEKLPVYEGELRSAYDHYVLRGVDSTRMPLKQGVQSTERELYAADAMNALLWLGRKYGYIPEEGHLTKDQIYAAEWARKRYMPVLSHDAICACGTDDTYPHMNARWQEARDAAIQVQRNVAAALERKEDTYGIHAEWGYGVSVINTLPHARKVLVEIPMAWVLEGAQDLTAHMMIGYEKVDVPVQIVQKADNRYAVCAVPLDGLSATNITLVPTEKHEKPSFESEFYSVTVNGNGTVCIVDKQTGNRVYGNIIEDCGDRGDEYNFCPVDGDIVRSTADGRATVTVLHDGPAFTELQITTTLLVPDGLEGEVGTARESVVRSGRMVEMPISTKVRLIKGVDRVEFKTTINNTARDHRVRVRFSTPNADSTVRAKEPYHMITRDAVPIQGGENWAEKLPIATSHNQNLITAGDLALFSKGLPEYEALTDDDGTIKEVALTLIRGVGYLSRGNLKTRGNGENSWAGPGAATPEAQILCEQTFEYAVNLRGQQRNSDVIQQANDYLHDAKWGPQGDSAKQVGAAVNNILRINEGSAVMSALRPTYDGDAVLARFYNPNDRPSAVSVDGVFTQAVRANAFGMPLDSADARNVILQPGEIVTIRLT